MQNGRAFIPSRHAEPALLPLRAALKGCYSGSNKTISASSRYQNNKTLKQVQGDGRKGFTLIELLVVILIIGILASVALPQYQRAVEKARFVQAVTLLETLHKACEVYYWTNGVYPTKRSQLDIDINLPENYSVVFYHPGVGDFALDMYIRQNGEVKLEYVHHLQRNGKPSQTKECRVWKDDPNLHYLCQRVSGKQNGSKTSSYTIYQFR